MLSVGKRDIAKNRRILTSKISLFLSLKRLYDIFYTLYMYNNCFYMILDKESRDNRENRKS